MGKMGYNVGIGIAILLCALVSISGVSGEIICEGEVTAQDIASNTWTYTGGGYYDVCEGLTHFVWVDQCMKVAEGYFVFEDVKVKKQAGVVWSYDEDNPNYDVIPDSVQSISQIEDWMDSSKVSGIATTQFVKKGSLGGPNYDFGLVDMSITLEFTDFSNVTTKMQIQPDAFITSWYSNDYIMVEDTIPPDIRDKQGIWIQSQSFNPNSPTNILFGHLSDTNRDIDVTSYFNFKNYYTVTENPTNIIVDVQREGGDLDVLMAKSKLRCYDEYGSILTESSWHTTNQSYTLPLTTRDIYLVPDFEDTTELYLCSYQSADTAKIYGYTYNAETGGKIPSVAVSLDSNHVDVSDVLGYYSVVFPPSVYTITASKEGYYDTVLENVMFPHDGDYAMDIGLIQKPPISAKPSILGLVRTLPRYYPVENQAVAIENGTWGTSTITNDFGYYIFPDLEAGNYYINVVRRGYEQNLHLVTVSDFHVLHNIDLEPKGWNIIEIIIEMIMVWWWLLLLLIALIVGALLLRGRKKVYIQHPKKGRKK